MKGLITLQHNDIECQFNEQGWFNATLVASRYGKRPNDWLNLVETKEYIKALLDVMGVSITSKNGNCTSLIKTKRGKEDGGTWLHPKLAVPFTRWLDVNFGVWCDLQIDQLLRGTHSITDWKRVRHQATATYKALTSVLQLSRQQQGKATKSHHYTNEAKLINWALNGNFAGLDRNTLSLSELDQLAKIEAQDLILIASNYSYEQRKTALSMFVQTMNSNALNAHNFNVLEA